MLKKLIVVEKTLIYFLLFLLPLLPATLNKGYDEIKVLGFLYLLMPAILLFLIKKTVHQEKIALTKLNLLTIIFVLTLTVTSVFGLDLQKSLLGIPPYFQGAIVFIFLAFFSYTVSQTHFSQKTVAKVLLTSALFVSLVALFQQLQLFFGVPIQTYAGRVVSTFGQPNFYAGFLVLTLPLWLYSWRQKEGKEGIVLLALLAVIILAISVSFSKTAILMTAVFFSVWMVNKLIRSKKIKELILVFTLIGFVTALSYTGIIQKEIIDPIIKQTVVDGNAEKRIYIWQVSLEVIAKSWVAGYGLENIVLAFPKEFDFNHPKPAFYHAIKDLTIDRTHNLFLDLLIMSGVVGLTSFGMLVGYVVIAAKNWFIKLGIVFFLVFASVQNLSIIHLLMFFLYIGLIRTKNH